MKQLQKPCIWANSFSIHIVPHWKESLEGTLFGIIRLLVYEEQEEKVRTPINTNWAKEITFVRNELTLDSASLQQSTKNEHLIVLTEAIIVKAGRFVCQAAFKKHVKEWTFKMYADESLEHLCFIKIQKNKLVASAGASIQWWVIIDAKEVARLTYES